ncbi:MAG: hypothetical protein KDE33_20995, partial [Bacteroidetes bacterium]|nr:hypothetical protein [Bacteroidota bacterium]
MNFTTSPTQEELQPGASKGIRVRTRFAEHAHDKVNFRRALPENIGMVTIWSARNIKRPWMSTNNI